MKKILVLATVFAFAIGMISVSAFASNNNTSFENLPISIKSSWRFGQNSYGSHVDLFLDLEITNHGKETIKNIGVFYTGQGYYPNGEIQAFKYNNWGFDLLRAYNSNSTISIRSGQTVSVSYPIGLFANISQAGEVLGKLEIDFYISSIRYAWFGGIWGKLPNFKIIDWSTIGTIFEDLDLTKIGLKIDIEPYVSK